MLMTVVHHSGCLNEVRFSLCKHNTALLLPITLQGRQGKWVNRKMGHDRGIFPSPINVVTETLLPTGSLEPGICSAIPPCTGE